MESESKTSKMRKNTKGAFKESIKNEIEVRYRIKRGESEELLIGSVDVKGGSSVKTVKKLIQD